MAINDNYPTSRPRVYNFQNTDQIDGRLNYSRASKGTYLGANGDIMTAPAEVPRFTYSFNPVTNTFNSEGLLVENATRNVLPNSFDNPNNTINGLSTASSWGTTPTTAPDGTTSVSDLVRQNATGICSIRCPSGRNPAAEAQTTAFTLITDQSVWTQSVFWKEGNTPGGVIPSLRMSMYAEAIDASGTEIEPTAIRWNISFVETSPGVFTISTQSTDGNFTLLSSSAIPLPDGWWRFSVTWRCISVPTGATGFAASYPYFIVLNAGTFTVGSSAYLWGQQLEEGPTSSPSEWEYTGATDLATVTNTPVPVTREADSLFLNAADITDDTASIQPSILVDVSVANTEAGFTLFVGNNADNSSQIASFQENSFLNYRVGAVNNSGTAYPDFPKVFVPDGRNKIVYAFGVPNVVDDSNAYSGSSTIRLQDATTPTIDQISFGRDAIGTGLDIPAASAIFRSIYIWEGELTAGESQTLIGESPTTIAPAPGRNDNLLQMRIITDPTFGGNLEFDLKTSPSNAGFGIYATGNVEVDYGNGVSETNNPVGSTIEFDYNSPGVYNVQISGPVTSISTAGSAQEAYNMGPQVQEVYSFGTALCSLTSFSSPGSSFPFRFQEWNNCTSYPLNKGDITANNILDTSSVTSFNSLFFNNHEVTQVPVLNCDSCTSFYQMLWNCYKLPKFEMNRGNSQANDVIEVPTAQDWTGSRWFYNCYALDSDNYPGNVFPTIDFSRCTNTSYMFSGASEIKALQTTMDFSKVTTSAYMYFNATKLTNIPFHNNYPNNNCEGGALAGMFQRVQDVPPANDAQWDCFSANGHPNLTSLTKTWCNSGNPNLPDDWDFSNVTNWFQTFYRSQYDGRMTKIPEWDYSSGVNCALIFTKQNQILFTSTSPVVDFGSATDVYSAFSACRAIQEIPCTAFPNVTDSYDPADPGSSGAYRIFYDCRELNPTLDANQRIPCLLGMATNNFTEAFRLAGVNTTTAQRENFATAILLTINEERAKANCVAAGNKDNGSLGMQNLPEPGVDYTNTAAEAALAALIADGWTVTF